MLDVPGVSNKNVVSSGRKGIWCQAPFRRERVPLVECHASYQDPRWNCSFMRMGLKMHTLIGKRLVIVGGSFAGLECASSMTEGREVTLVEESKKQQRNRGR